MAARRAGRRRGEAGQVAGVEPGRQGLDPVAVEQDVNLAETRPEPDGAPGHRGPEPDLLSRDPEIARRRDYPVQLYGLAMPAAAAGAWRGRCSRPVVRFGFFGASGRLQFPGQLGGYPQAEPVSGGAVNRAAGNAMFRDWCGRLVL